MVRIPEETKQKQKTNRVVCRKFGKGASRFLFSGAILQVRATVYAESNIPFSPIFQFIAFFFFSRFLVRWYVSKPITLRVFFFSYDVFRPFCMCSLLRMPLGMFGSGAF